MSASMRAGLAKQTETINKLLDDNARFLDDAYDFGSLMLPNNVMPPVVRKVERVTEQTPNVLTFSALQFQIVKQASFATRPPTWRTYLPIASWDNGSTHPSLLPTNAEEREAARQGIEQGWAAGVDQANQMFFRGLTRLQNDFVGMSTYHALLKSNMVTAPIVIRRDTAIAGNSDNMVVDQSTYRIEARPVFNPNIAQWLAIAEKSGIAGVFDSMAKPTDAEAKRASVAAPSMRDLLRAWTGQQQ